jgi:hypothetical protein
MLRFPFKFLETESDRKPARYDPKKYQNERRPGLQRLLILRDSAAPRSPCFRQPRTITCRSPIEIIRQLGLFSCPLRRYRALNLTANPRESQARLNPRQAPAGLARV